MPSVVSVFSCSNFEAKGTGKSNFMNSLSRRDFIAASAGAALCLPHILSAAPASGWAVVSMKDDWKQMFPVEP
jgi:hypothetical protein